MLANLARHDTLTYLTAACRIGSGCTDNEQNVKALLFTMMGLYFEVTVASNPQMPNNFKVILVFNLKTHKRNIVLKSELFCLRNYYTMMTS